MEAKPGHTSTYGQPGFQQQGQQQQFMTIPVNSKPPVSKFWRISKLVLIPISLVFCIVAISLLAAIAAQGSSYEYYYYSLPTLAFLMGGPQVILATLWDVAELIAICARTGHRGIHPGAHVGVHLIICLGLGAGTALLAFETGWDAENLSDYSSYSYSYYDYSDVVDALNATIPLEGAAAGIEGVILIIHFILFVMACVETHRRNRGARMLDQQQVVIVMPPQQQQQQMQQQQPPVAPNGYYYAPVTAAAAQQQGHQPQYMAVPTQQHQQAYQQQPAGQPFGTSSPSITSYPTPPPQAHGQPNILAPSPVHASRLSSAAQSLQQQPYESHPHEMGHASPPPPNLAHGEGHLYS